MHRLCKQYLAKRGTILNRLFQLEVLIRNGVLIEIGLLLNTTVHGIITTEVSMILESIDSVLGSYPEAMN